MKKTKQFCQDLEKYFLIFMLNGRVGGTSDKYKYVAAFPAKQRAFSFDLNQSIINVKLMDSILRRRLVSTESICYDQHIVNH